MDGVALLTVFVLAIFVGYEVISKVSSTLHTPLMSGSNAISGIILGAPDADRAVPEHPPTYRYHEPVRRNEPAWSGCMPGSLTPPTPGGGGPPTQVRRLLIRRKHGERMEKVLPM